EAIESLKKELLQYKEEQTEQISNLLAGATSVNLSKAFYDQAAEAKKKKLRAETAFIISIVLMLAMICVSYTDVINLPSIMSTHSWYVSLLIRISFSFPLIWSAMYFSSKGSQYFRLEQEYNHKEAVSRSF